MTEPTTLPPGVERSALCDTVRSHLSRRGGVLLTGPAGIGRTTVVARLSAELRTRGHQVLSCSPSPAEQDSPFLGLIDLLADAADDTLASLASHERAALEGALLRGESAGPAAGRDALVLRIAVRKVLALLGTAGPVLLVVDDAQWLDRPTAEVLKYLARRADSGLSVLATLRTGDDPGSSSDRSVLELCAQPVRRICVPPLTAHEVGELLERHDHPSWPRPLLARLHQASGGNPRTALELSSALDERVRLEGNDLPDSTEPLPVPDSLRRPILDRIGALPASARQTLVVAGTAVRPTVELLRRAGCRHASADLDTCVRGGIIRIVPASDHGTIRFLDPLTPMVLQSETPYERLLEAHRVLADASDDAVERAHHVARLAAGPDPVVAARLSAAASAARRRGAPRTAARLGRLAAEYT
ncbi:AAA family ATPase, partial [Streptomyces violascens]|uniref:AAA family ATPase n=1 Tax=Streptomyces violascens TaxID=67381 RepID=UPI0036B45AAE